MSVRLLARSQMEVRATAEWTGRHGMAKAAGFAGEAAAGADRGTLASGERADGQLSLPFEDDRCTARVAEAWAAAMFYPCWASMVRSVYARRRTPFGRVSSRMRRSRGLPRKPCAPQWNGGS